MATIRIGDEYLEVPDVEEAPAEKPAEPVIEMPPVRKPAPKGAHKPAPVEKDD